MADHVRLDAIDHEILVLLQRDARRTIADIAERVNLSPAPVKRRIDRMERAGVIAGYTALVDHSHLGSGVEAMIELRFAGHVSIEDMYAVAQRIDEIEEISTVAGDPDAVLRVRVDSVEHLQQVIDELRRTGLVTGTKTMMVLGTWRRTQ